MPLLREVPGVLGVALSGAGPGMLLIVARDLDAGELERSLQKVLAEPGDVELLQCGFADTGAGRDAARQMYKNPEIPLAGVTLKKVTQV